MHGLVTGQDPRDRCGDLELKLENPLGFFESEILVQINEFLLQALGSQWDRPPLLPAIWDQPPLLHEIQLQRNKLESYALEQAWVDKDPRLCITYPAYLHILLRRIPLVVALREPLAVATSLHARNGFSLNHGLVLWWIYNHHIASQLCSNDLLVPYSTLLELNDRDLQQLLGPFLETHRHQRPSNDQARNLIKSFLKPDFNRSEDALSSNSISRVRPDLLRICDLAYKSIMHSDNKLTLFQEQFNALPRVVLECSARDQLLPESQAIFLRDRLHLIESEMRDVVSSFEQEERNCASLRHELNDLQNSRSWKITSPLRAVSDYFRSTFG